MHPRFQAPRKPVVIESAYEDPERVFSLVRKNAPYWPTLRYVAKPEEFEAVSRATPNTPRVLVPWFRGDWANGKPLVEGAELILENPRFIEAARKVFDAEIVSPSLVYVNMMAPLPFAGEGHIDVPAFRGIDRSEYPIWLLQQMTRSGLFADWQIDIATAVSWFYEGEGGTFDYWADGPSNAPQQIASPFGTEAVVGDNDFMFHRVGSIGQDATMLEASLDAELFAPEAGSSEWRVLEGDREVARYSEEAIRVSVSWKAEVFADQAASDLRTQHQDDLTLELVIDRFLEDLAGRGCPAERPKDPLRDSEFIRALTDVYTLPDLVYPTEQETEAKRSKPN